MIRAILVAAALLLLPGCTPARRSTDAAAADTEIVRDVSWALRKETRFREVEVLCSGGVVTLRGTVTTAQDKADAEHRAGSTRGVVEVRSQVAVRSR